MQYGLYLITIVAALALPWWVATLCMILAMSYPAGAQVALGSALLIDSLYGTGYAFTGSIGLAGLVATYLHQTLID